MKKDEEGLLMTDKSAKLIEQIIAIELEMFLAVPTGGENRCQKNPEAFCLHRRAQFIPWSEKTLSSYLSDLETARLAGRNLMTEKYLMMEKSAPSENDQRPASKNKRYPDESTCLRVDQAPLSWGLFPELVEKIVSSQLAWQKEMFARYPKVMNGARPLVRSADSSAMTSFVTYLKSELQTYSAKTLTLLYEDIIDRRKDSLSMAEETYQFLVRAAGYTSLAQAENILRNRGH